MCQTFDKSLPKPMITQFNYTYVHYPASITYITFACRIVMMKHKISTFYKMNCFDKSLKFINIFYNFSNSRGYSWKSFSWKPRTCVSFHYSDVIMGTIASQITSLPIVYSTVLFRRRSQGTSKLHVTGFCAGNSPVCILSLRWRHNGHNSVSNHQPPDLYSTVLFRRKSKETSKLHVTGLCVGNSPGTAEFPAQMASNTENVSIWWHHHV